MSEERKWRRGGGGAHCRHRHGLAGQRRRVGVLHALHAGARLAVVEGPCRQLLPRRRLQAAQLAGGRHLARLHSPVIASATNRAGKKARLRTITLPMYKVCRRTYYNPYHKPQMGLASYIIRTFAAILL